MKHYQNNELADTWWHGTAFPFPFAEFDPRSIGSGLVTRGVKHGGFYFTSSKDNALFYSEYWVCKCSFTVDSYTTESTHPPTIMKTAVESGEIVGVRDVLDGSHMGDVAMVPSTRAKDIRIDEWILEMDVDEWAKLQIDEIVGDDEDDRNRDHVEDMIGFYTDDSVWHLPEMQVLAGYVKDLP